jgi:DNA-binding CsgD family transcriptional regulator
MDDRLLERDREIAALDRLIAGACDGSGAAVLIEGPAGIGKTRLLASARERAGDRMTVLTARCSELEREFSFGTVRQLFEPPARDPDRRARLLAGAAAPAEGVLGAPEGDAEGTFAVLHGLYWATLNLAEDRPVLIAIDDLQWSDRPSLRFVAYLAARLEGAPVLLAATVRSTDPGTDPQLLAEIAADPLSQAVRPGPLGEAAVAEMISERLGDAQPQFVAACIQATGGNPLLLRHVLTALAEDGIPPTATGAVAVRGIGSRAVSRTVLLRLSRLREDAATVARAVAVLGESSKLPTVAALTGLSEDAVARAAGDLARAEILRPDPPLGFVHPLVRDAVYLDVPAGERELQHGRAAAVLADAYAPDAEVAAQLVHAPRRGDADTVERLRAAARLAIRRSGPENAMVYLERALDEPPPPELRPQLHFDLGAAAAETNAPKAVEHLVVAHRDLADPAARANAAFALAQSQLFIGEAREGAALARAAAAELPPELADLRRMIESIELLSAFFGADAGVIDRLADYRTPVGDDLGAKMIAAASAFAWGAGGGPARDVEALVVAAWEGGDLLATGNGLIWSAASVAAMLSESPQAPAMQAQIREAAYRRGGVFGITSSELFEGAYLLLAAGDVEQGAEAVGIALDTQELWGSDPTANSWARGLAGLGAFLSGDTAAARTALGALPPPAEGSDGANLCRRTMAEILLAEARPEPALELADQMGATALHVRHPDWKPWQSLKARALAQLGRDEEALELMMAELELARGVGGDRVIGRCLRQLGELAGDAGEPQLHEAVEHLSRTPAKLELARAFAALGALQRRTRRPTEAREPLRQALELAERCACPPLVEAVRSELYATGARPRTAALGGVEALTARELRVATMAADGHTNREIAQALYVTPKTVEVHLSNAYRKLDISSRRELAGALSAA